MTRQCIPFAAIVALGLVAQPGVAAAQAGANTPGDGVGAAEPATSGNPATPADTGVPATSIQSSLGPYGDPGGVRRFLASQGVTYNVTYIGEVLGNATGGLKRGASFEGLLQPQVDIDLDKLAHVEGVVIHASALQIHGRGLSGNNILNNFVVSSIEAYPDTMLFEAWAEKTLADGKLFVRAGQLSADTEFFISQTATLFVNSTFGWPTSYGVNLPSGGPAFPLGALGTRVKFAPTDEIAFMAAILDGDPAGPFVPGATNPIVPLRDRGGVAFRLDDAPFVVTEAQYNYNQQKDAKGLPGSVRIGYFHHFGAFASSQQDGGVFSGQNGLYGIIDQTIFREPGTDDQGASVFARGTLSPRDRSVFDLYADAGIAYKGLVPGRDDDTVGVGAGYGRISPDLTLQDRMTGAAPLIRDYEAIIEATYQYLVSPGFTLQPDFQYILHPGANGVADNYGQPLPDSAIFGMRATLVY